MVTIAEKIFNSYPHIFQPPKESLKLVLSPKWNTLSKKVRLYYTDGDIKVAKMLATRRDLVNIGNNQHYNVKKLKEIMGWSESGYTSYFKNTDELAPQIGIYCRCPVLNSELDIHIMNSIGLAFDSKSQPDFQYFNEIDFEFVPEHMANSFEILFKCAAELKLKKIVLCYLGGGNFSKYYPFNFLKNAYIPALKIALDRFSHKNLPNSIGIMGNVENKISKQISVLLSKYNISFESKGFVPHILDSEDTLYQNAWDPHSMVGNGNKGDNSLDGFFGRNVPMHFLCWPLTNKNIKYIKL